MGLMVLAGLGAGALFFAAGDKTGGIPEEKDLLAGSRGNSLASAAAALADTPREKILASGYHVFQSRNNCGPAAYSMALSYSDVRESMQTLANALRPFQNQAGDNDDKSVTPEEIARHAEGYGLISYYRPNGTVDLVKRLIANDIPVLTRTLLEPHDDIAHYRVIRGYNDATGEFIQDDGLQGKNLRYSYSEFLKLWGQFNYGYIIIARPEKKAVVETILGEETDPSAAWRNAVERSESELRKNPNDVRTRFALSAALYHAGSSERAIEEFEGIRGRLPPHVLWYQIEPIQAYFSEGRYDEVFSLTESILNNQNRAFSELYLLRGESYLKQGRSDLARIEFEKAVLYNKNMEETRAALNSL